MSDAESPSGGLYEWVAPNLYRHSLNGRYYGVKKISGKRKERSLKTSDRQIANRRLREWLDNLHKIDSEVEKTTLRQLLQTFQKTYLGKSESTRETNKYISEKFKLGWLHGLDIEVRNIRPSQLDEWLGRFEASIKHTTYNRYVGFLRQLFDIAVKDKIIAESPAEQLATKWKRPQPPVRRVPTVAQFEAIIADVRGQKFTDHAEDSGDFLEFLGLAGLGQAETSALVWSDVDFGKDGGLSIKRQKTHQRFKVPMYAHLRPFMERMKAKAEDTSHGTKVFKIKDGKKALEAACKRLKLPPFSQRSLRQCLIRRLWEAGVDVKLISKWQGHNDGGQLIMDTYTEVFGDNDGRYVEMQLQKLFPK